MTTAFAHMAQGQLVAAIRTQAFGTAVFVVTVVAAVAGTVQAASARNLLGRLRVRTWWLIVVLVSFLAAWVVKILIDAPHA